jgi:hypothetical protein
MKRTEVTEERGNKGECSAMIQQPLQYAAGEPFPMGRFASLYHAILKEARRILA